jgi:hypothetical protein
MKIFSLRFFSIDGGNIPRVPLGSPEHLGVRFKNMPIGKSFFLFLFLSFLMVQNVVGQIVGPCGTTITVTNASNPTATDGKIVLTPTLTNKNYYAYLGIVGSEMYGEMLKSTASSKLVLTGLVAGTYNVRVYREDTTGLNPCGQINQSVTVGAGSYATCVGTEIGGYVFHDANENGSREAGEGGASGVTVNAYNSAGTLVGTQTSDAQGLFKFTGLAAAQPYRLEYAWTDGYLQSGAIGTSSGSSVQFVTSGTCTANLGINYPANYCQTSNPYVVTPCYINGNPQAAAVAPLDVMVAFPYKAANIDFGVPGQNIAPTHVAAASQIGATWGVAYQKTTKYAFTSAVLRRFAGFGPLGTGGIYKIDMTIPTAPVVSNWVNVKSIGINTGNDTRNGTTANTLSIAPGTPTWDAEAFNQIGKIGIGGIDFNDRGDTLWLMNLAEKKLYGLKNVTPSVTPTAANVIGGYTVALPAGYTCATNVNDFRPWAVKYYKGLVYVGAVCSGESTPWSSFNLRGFVLSFNPANPAAGFSYVTDFPLDYTRYAYGTAATFTFQTWMTNATIQYSAAQPIVSDLEFDLDGSMIVALADRGGLQGGNNNYYADPTATNTTLLESNTFGDLLRFCKTGSTYIQSGVVSCPNPADNIFPTPEYYWGDVGPLICIRDHFNESGAGSIAFLAGSGSVLGTAQDAYGWYSGGTIAFSNTSGGDLWRYTVYDPTVAGSSGKATGLGDIEPLCNPAPIEIGNRVWVDTDQDGIQDAGEPGLAGVQVQLYQGATLVTTVTTDADGNYKFTNLLPNTAYTITVPLGQTALVNKPLTTTNVGSNDLIDNDMVKSGSNGVISLTTGYYGENSHTYDIGFQPCLVTLTTSVSDCYDSNGNTAGGTNVVNVQVIVDWTNNPSGETINVTCTGATAQSVNPATSLKPAILNFVVPANAATVTVAAAFSITTTCSASQTITAPAGNCLLEPCAAGNVGGKVWLDFNSNGIKDAGETTGVAGVIVKAYNAAGILVETDTTDYLGQYVFTTFTPTTTNKYRIEFTNIPPQYKPTFHGTDGGTDVQFVSAADCTVDFGVNNPADYCQLNPPLITPCYVNGATNTTSPTDVLVRWSYNNSGLVVGDETPIASKAQIGSTWGLAYRKSTKKIYAAAFLKRYVGLLDNNGDGNGDLGAIYEVSPSTSTNVLWLNLETLGINCGTIGNNAARGLGAPTAASNDAAAFDNVGKIGLGDLDISDDESTLYVTNLFDKKLYAIDIASKTITGSWVIPDPNCGTFTSGILRINAGSETNFTDATGTIWNADVQYIRSRKVSNTNTITNTYTNGTSGQTLYQTYNQPFFNTDMAYAIPMANGSYTIKLHFSEPTFTAVGLRQFNVAIEGTTVLTNFDIFATAGAANKAIVQTFTTTVTGGVLDLLFSKGAADNAIVSGIEILSNAGTGTTVAAGSYRPFATKYYRGKVYVGVICDAQQSLNEDLMSANVYEFNGSTFTNVLTFPLNYTKANVYDIDGQPKGWHPWTSLIVGTKNDGITSFTYQQPLLSDIEFDINGDMILGFMDRFGHQMGSKNYGLTGTTLLTGESAGDILRAAKFGNVFIIENNAVAGAITGKNPNNQQGPRGGEFYNDNIRGGHNEQTIGGLALLTGSGEVVTNGYAVLEDFDQGIIFYSNTTGDFVDRYQIVKNVTTTLFGKSNGLGDLELLCNPAPLEIGNYVWLDTDKDGVQDANEKPLSNVTVTLWKNNVQIAATVTSAIGEYYFSDKNAVGVTWAGTGADTTLVPNMSYQVKIYRKQPVLDTTSLTTSNSIINGGNDLNDSDAFMFGDTAVINLTTGTAGSVNHTYDFGFFPCINAITLTTQPAGFSECLGGTFNLTVVASGSTPPYTYKWQNGGATGTTWTDISGATAASYTPLSTSTGTTLYRVIVSGIGGASCDTIISSVATVIIVNDPVVSVTTLPTTVCVGANLALTANSSGGTGTCTLQWQSSPDGVTWSNISGATSNTLNVNSINSTTRYRAQMTCTGSGCCN